MHSVRPRLRFPLGAALIGLLLVTGCTSGAAGTTTPTWVPQPDFQASDPQPSLPGQGVPAPEPSNPGSSGPNSSSPGTSPSPGQSKPATDPAVVATKLNQPTGLVVLPDGTALVGERTTGRILRVQPQAGKPAVLVQTLAGVKGTGDGGLLDLALSPTFAEDGLVYAYLTTATDNRVVHFAIGSAPSPVITGIPRGTTGNVGRIAFDGTGALLTGTGNAGKPALAASPTSLAGKILRSDDIGKPMSDNPTPGSLIYATGLRTVNGLCVDPQSGLRFAVSAGKPDQIFAIKAGADLAHATAAAKLPAATSGGAGCAALAGRIVAATTTGKALSSATVSSTGAVGAFSVVLQGKYGRLRTVVAGADGALWFTTGNRDGLGKPIAADDRVIRISSSSASGGQSVL
jgi:glucose/arabinose dehydrogenase